MVEKWDLDNEIVAEPSFEFDNFAKEGFSHQILVMEAYRKALNSSAQEMRKGYVQDRTDKYGNVVTTIFPDTRLELISAVETLRIVTTCDQDKKAKDKIQKLLLSVNNFYKLLCSKEHTWYMSLNHQVKANVFHLEGHLSQEGSFYQNYINFKVEIYRQIFEAIEESLKRLKYMRKELNIA